MTTLTSRHTYNRWVALFHSNLRIPKLVLGELGLILGVGLLWISITNGNIPTSLQLISKMLPLGAWGVIFVLYGMFRVCTSLTGRSARVSCWNRYFGPAVGTWLWGCMLIAGIMMIDFNVTTILYIIPMQLEIWIVSQTVFWWTKFDMDVLRAIPGALSPVVDCSCVDDHHH